MNLQENLDPICCPEFNPEPWENKLFEWKDKLFIKDRVCTAFYMPLNFGRVMKRLDKKIREANATVPDSMGLSDHTSKWNMDLLLAIDKKFEGVEFTTLSGKFFSKVYEGPFQDTAKWMKDFEADVKEKQLTTLKTYMWYTTCPKCAKKYGKNYVVVIGNVD